MKGHLDVKELEKYRKANLQALARELGVSDAGTVKEIAARCAEVETDIPDESEQKAAKDAESAGKVKVEVTTRYLDKSLHKIKTKGEVLTVDKDRAAELMAAGVAKIKE